MFSSIKIFFVITFYKVLRKFFNYFNISFSFSSDGEDYVLSKILGGIKNGNYIDIGANHPILHSNTFSFYLRGWRGVCVDPIPSLVNKFRFYRSDDVFLSAGLDSNGSNKSLPSLNFSTSLHKLMADNGYKLGMRTFLSSIYILESRIPDLKSPFTNEWIV